jgi:hypothetical protein
MAITLSVLAVSLLGSAAVPRTRVRSGIAADRNRQIALP